MNRKNRRSDNLVETTSSSDSNSLSSFQVHRNRIVPLLLTGFLSLLLAGTLQAAKPTAPAAPSGLGASAMSSNRIDLAWADNSSNESGFIVYRAMSASGPWTQIATTAQNTRSYSSLGLNSGTTYYFRVCAYNSKGNSGYAGPANATTDAPPPPCTYTISPNSASPAASGATGTVTVNTTNATCPWTATSSAGWITITGGGSGTGSGVVSYSVAANTSTNSRTGTMTIAGLTFTVNQSGTPPCTYSISPSSASVAAGGATGTVTVTESGTCPWTATSGAVWITITSGASGAGSGSVGYTVAANTSTSTRTGTMTIAGLTFTINQAAATGGPDTTPPSVSLTSPGSGSTISNTVTLTVSASDNVGVTRVEYYTDFTFAGSATTAPFSVAFDTHSTPNGSQGIMAKAYDAAGNWTISPSVTVNVNNPVLGVPQWVRDMPSYLVMPAGVVADHANNIVVAGGFASSVNFGGGTIMSLGGVDSYIAKYSSQNALLWAKTIGTSGDERIYGVAVDSQNNVIVTGSFMRTVDFGGISLTASDPYGQSQPDAFVAKYSPSGALLWVIQGFTVGLGKAVAVDSNDNIFLAAGIGTSASFGGVSLGAGLDIALVKLSPAGSGLWAKGFNSTIGGDSVKSLAIAAGDVLIGGLVSGPVNFGGGASVTGGAFIARFSGANGGYQWAQVQAGDWAKGIAVDSSTGNIFVVGASSLKAYTSSGATLWFSATGGNAIAVDGSGNLAITGDGVFAAAYTTSGTLRWTRNLGVGSGYGLAYDTLNHLIATGIFQGAQDFGGISVTAQGLTDGFVVQYAK